MKIAVGSHVERRCAPDTGPPVPSHSPQRGARDFAGQLRARGPRKGAQKEISFSSSSDFYQIFVVHRFACFPCASQKMYPSTYTQAIMFCCISPQTLCSSFETKGCTKSPNIRIWQSTKVFRRWGSLPFSRWFLNLASFFILQIFFLRTLLRTSQ